MSENQRSCDHFINNRNLISFTLNIGFYPNAINRLIFYNYKSILPATYEKGKITFNNIPVNERVHLVTFYHKDNQLFLFEKEILIDSKLKAPKIKIEPISAQALIQKIRQIESAVASEF